MGNRACCLAPWRGRQAPSREVTEAEEELLAALGRVRELDARAAPAEVEKALLSAAYRVREASSQGPADLSESVSTIRSVTTTTTTTTGTDSLLLDPLKPSRAERRAAWRDQKFAKAKRAPKRVQSPLAPAPSSEGGEGLAETRTVTFEDEQEPTAEAPAAAAEAKGDRDEVAEDDPDTAETQSQTTAETPVPEDETLGAETPAWDPGPVQSPIAAPRPPAPARRARAAPASPVWIAAPASPVRVSPASPAPTSDERPPWMNIFTMQAQLEAERAALARVGDRVRSMRAKPRTRDHGTV